LARHGDEVLDAAGDGTPKGVNEAENGIAGGYVLRNDADGQEVVDLIEGDLGALLLLEDGVEALDAPFDAGFDIVIAELLNQRVFHAAQELLTLNAPGFDGCRNLFVTDGVDVAEG
jgi:hypothetical protein